MDKLGALVQLAMQNQAANAAPAGMPQQTRNPYEAGLRADPANLGEAGRIEGDLEAQLVQRVLQNMRKQPAQLPQDVKRPPMMR